MECRLSIKITTYDSQTTFRKLYVGQGRENYISDELPADSPTFSESTSFSRVLRHGREEMQMAHSYYVPA